MKHILYKLSIPRFEKSFDSREELRSELVKHICSDCCSDSSIEVVDIEYMLSTSCGCEFDVFDPIETPATNLELLEEKIRKYHQQ